MNTVEPGSVEAEPDFLTTINYFAIGVKNLQRRLGVSSEKLMRAIGSQLGAEIARNLTSNEPKQLFEELGAFFEQLRLGEVEVSGEDPAVITIKGCLGCERIEDPGKVPNCPLQEEMIKAIFEERLGVETRVKMLARAGYLWGSKRCQFRVEIQNPRKEVRI